MKRTKTPDRKVTSNQIFSTTLVTRQLGSGRQSLIPTSATVVTGHTLMKSPEQACVDLCGRQQPADLEVARTISDEQVRREGLQRMMTEKSCIVNYLTSRTKWNISTGDEGNTAHRRRDPPPRHGRRPPPPGVCRPEKSSANIG